MKCFYHSADLDGHCSGAIVRLFEPQCEMIGINYGDDFQWDDIADGETVYMVDFSLQPFDDMIKLFQKCNLIWIDHHISAITDSVDQQANTAIDGLRRDGIGACQLCWEYFGSEGCHNKPVPHGVKLLAEHDVWNHSDPNTLPFQYAMRLEDTHPTEEAMISVWEPILFDVWDAVSQRINSGKTVLKYVNQSNEKYCKAASFTTQLDGLRCIAVNKMLTNSQVFDSVWDASKFDAMLTFGFRKGKWTVSLYTDKPEIDVSIVAKARGGGGHKQAAGFQCDDLPFLLAA